MFKEIVVLDALFELVLPDKVTSYITDEWVDVNERMDTVGFPLLAGFLPFRIDLFVELPVPEEASALDELLGANPILHPEGDHWNTLLLQQVVFGVDFFLTTLK